MVMLGRLFAGDYGWYAAAIDGPVHGERGPVTDASDPAYRQMWQRPEVVQDMIDDWTATLDALSALSDVDPTRVLRFCRPYHDQQRTPDVGDMLQNVVFLQGSILLNEDLGSHRERYGIDGVDQGPWLATVKMLLCLGRDACELLAAPESGVSGIRKPRW
jgi:hypothetical protein